VLVGLVLQYTFSTKLRGLIAGAPGKKAPIQFQTEQARMLGIDSGSGLRSAIGFFSSLAFSPHYRGDSCTRFAEGAAKKKARKTRERRINPQRFCARSRRRCG
jgi:hypothetical protein